MIKGYYSGYHYLELSTAYRNAAWEGLYFPESIRDPLISSLSNFKKLCRNKNISIEYGTNYSKEEFDLENISFENFPIIFIVSVSSTEILKILEWVQLGANLLIFNASGTFGENLSDEYNKTTQLINSVTKIDKSKNDEALKYGIGQIFYLEEYDINDYSIEPGPFGVTKEESINAKIESINKIIGRISSFSLPLIDISINSFPTTFPVNEPMFIEIRVFNIGDSNIQNLQIEIQLPDELEPISATYIEIGGIKKADFHSIALICKPLYKGEFSFNIDIQISHSILKRKHFNLTFETNILDNLRNLVGSSNNLKFDTTEKIIEVEKYLKPTTDSKQFIKLLETDPGALIAKTRKILEYIVKEIGAKNLRYFKKDLPLHDILKNLYVERKIDNKLKSYADTVRLFGNMASHSEFEREITFTTEDAITVSNSLIQFISECISQKLLR
jgi:hypothetical protein